MCRPACMHESSKNLLDVLLFVPFTLPRRPLQNSSPELRLGCRRHHGPSDRGAIGGWGQPHILVSAPVARVPPVYLGSGRKSMVGRGSKIVPTDLPPWGPPGESNCPVVDLFLGRGSELAHDPWVRDFSGDPPDTEWSKEEAARQEYGTTGPTGYGPSSTLAPHLITSSVNTRTIGVKRPNKCLHWISNLIRAVC